MADLPSQQSVVTREVRIVDEAGDLRILLSADYGTPTIVLLREDGQSDVTVRLDTANHPSDVLANPNSAWPTAAIEIDDKGAYVKFDRPGVLRRTCSSTMAALQASCSPAPKAGDGSTLSSMRL